MPVTRYRERLWLGPVGWASIAGFAVSLGVAYAAASSPLWGYAVAGVTALACMSLAARTAPVVRVSDFDLTAARAQLPLAAAGGVRPLSAADLAALRRRPEGSGGWWCAPGWVRTGIIVTVNDATDPHAFWVVATRRPRELADALVAAGVPRWDHEPPTDR